MMTDIRHRAEHGLRGGEALSAVFVPSDILEISVFDESNAFTWIRTPNWMHSWIVAPPVLARDVWSLLDAETKRAVKSLLVALHIILRLARCASVSRSITLHVIILIISAITQRASACVLAVTFLFMNIVL